MIFYSRSIVLPKYKSGLNPTSAYGRKTLYDYFSCLIVTGVGGYRSPSPNVYLMKKEHKIIH